MRLEEDIDFTTLGWVKPQIDETLQQARQALEAYVEDPADASLMRFCASYLHQVQGSLRMVELHGAAMLAEEMENLAQAILAGKAADRDEAFTVLLRGLVQLPDYLENVQAGHKDIPIVLLPLLNELRGSRGAQGVAESALFSPDLERPLPGDAPGARVALPFADLRQRASQLRARFDVPLLAWVRDGELDGFGAMREALDGLGAISHVLPARRLWWIAGGVLEALQQMKLDPHDAAIKQQFGRVDRAIKQMQDEGEDALADDDTRDLTRTLLYHIAQVPPGAARADAIRRGYALDSLLPSADELERARGSMTGRNRALLDTVAQAVREDLLRVREALDIFLRQHGGDPSDLAPHAETLQRVADTLGMLGLGVPRRVVGEQREILEAIAAKRSPAEEETLMGVAGALLFVDASLDDHIERIGTAEPGQDEDETALPRAEARRIVEALMREAVTNLARVKDDIVAFIESPWAHDRVLPVPKLLDEIGGALRMLDQPRPAELLGGINRFVENELIADRRIPTAEQMDTLADALAGIEYCLESARDAQGVNTRILDGTQHSLQKLGYWPLPPLRVAAPVVEPEHAAVAAFDEAPVHELTEAVSLAPGEDLAALVVGEMRMPQVPAHELAGLHLVSTEAPHAGEGDGEWVEVEEEVDEPVTAPADASFHDAVGIDADIREVFVEEVGEEINGIRENLPAWKANPEDLEALKPIRRSFHTLKGSGRLVGALALGEFSWKIENMLNRVLDRTIAPDANVQAVVDHALAALPQLHAALQGGPAPQAQLGAITQAADQLAEGQPVRVEDFMQKQKVLRRVRRWVPRVAETEAVPVATLAELPAAEQTVAAEPVAAFAGPVLPPVDPILLETLRAEVGQHLDTMRDYLARCDGATPPVDDALVRAAHTLHGAVAMVEIPVVGEVLTPLEGWLKRLRAQNAAPDHEGIAALRDSVALTDHVIAQFDAATPMLPDSGALAERLARLRDALPEASMAELLHHAPTAPDAEQAEREEAARIEAEHRAEEERQAEAARLEAERQEQERLAAERAEQERIEAEHRAEEERQAEAARLEAERQDQERVAAARAEQERLEAEHRAEEERQAEAARLEAERQEQERLAAERAEQERIEAERRAEEERQAEAVRLEAERQEQERVAAARAEQERLEAERAERERIEAERRAERERREAEVRAEQESIAAEQRERANARSAAFAALPPFPNDPQPEGKLDLPDIDPDLLEIFTQEGVELLDHSDGLMAQLRDAPELREPVVGMQRDLHTLKGGARVAGIAPIGDLAHAMETLLEMIADGRRKAEPIAIESLERGVDRLHTLLQRVIHGQALALPANAIARFEALAAGQAVATAAQPASKKAAAAAEPAKPAHAPRPGPRAAPSFEEETRAPQEMIRVRPDLLDSLVNSAGEVSIYRARLEQQVSSFRLNLVELEQTVARLRTQLRALEIETEAQILSRYQRENEGAHEAVFDPLELDRYSQLQQYSRALGESVSDLVSLQTTLDDQTRQSETLLLQQSRVSSDLQEGLMRTRMVPFESMVPSLRRTVRQAASELGKRAQLRVEGAQGEMDRNLLERMKAPFEHMLRNALAHGIEDPDTRRARNKPEEGTVTIQVGRESTEVLVRVSDDGAGFDRDAIRAKAIERGLLNPDVQLSDRDLYAFVLETGFSTAESVTQIAGRGVGMDVVANEIKQLGGTLTIDSERGRGTTFNIRLPFTLAVTQAIIVRNGETQFAVPMTSIQGVARISRADLEQRIAGGAPTITYAGEDYAIHDLAHLLGLPPSHQADEGQQRLLLSRSGDLRAAVRIDVVVGSREIVVKPVGPQVSSVPGIFGATIMGDGSVMLILDLAPLARRSIALHERAQLAGAAVPQLAVAREQRRQPLVMVVDDSITMRKVTGRVLERQDIEVLTAKDGLDAVEKLQDRVPDLMLLDIEMPRMDGYELATYMKNDARLRGVPIMMITSRTGEKHRQRAFEIGVERYLGKPYQEADLLRNVQEMLEAAHV